MSGDGVLGSVLLELARHAIECAILPARIPDDAGATPGQAAAMDLLRALRAPGASFVTLTQNGRLRGCIGTPQAWRSLEDDVQANAVAAALQDPRFKPLQASEWPQTRLEVSVLSPLEPLLFEDEADALAQLRPYVDGLVLSCGRHRATFLPQVWTQLPDPVEFLAQLKRKAGLPAHFWAPDLQLQRFTVSKWKEPA